MSIVSSAHPTAGPPCTIRDHLAEIRSASNDLHWTLDHAVRFPRRPGPAPRAGRHRVVAFDIGNRHLAQQCGEHLCKGRLVYVEGRLQTRRWEGQDGVKRYTTEVVADDVQFLDRTNQREADHA